MTTHDKEHWHGKRASERTAKKHSRQRPLRTHGKDAPHDKEGNERTTKRKATAKAPSIAVHPDYAVRPNVVHGKGAFAMRLFLCHAQYRFFISILFFLILYVYFQLVLNFVDNLLVLLKIMCIYPCFLQYKHTLHRHPPNIYQGFRANHASGNVLIVIAYV
jgi:hypothetical protein